MKIGSVVLKLRLADTIFKNNIGGSAQLALAMNYTIKKDTAFVVQMDEVAAENKQQNNISQIITERFGVIVALDNGGSDKDKLGIIAHDRLYDIRAQIFKALLGWQMPGAESLVSYGGGKVVRIDRAYLWYQFEFLVDTRLSDDDGVDVGKEDLEWFDTLYAQWIIQPSAKMDAIGENLPVTIVDPDMTTIIDFTTNSEVDGAYGSGFRIGFDTYKPK